jgi:hypothetical protein
MSRWRQTGQDLSRIVAVKYVVQFFFILIYSSPNGYQRYHNRIVHVCDIGPPQTQMSCIVTLQVVRYCLCFVLLATLSSGGGEHHDRQYHAYVEFQQPLMKVSIESWVI